MRICSSYLRPGGLLPCLSRLADPPCADFIPKFVSWSQTAAGVQRTCQRSWQEEEQRSRTPSLSRLSRMVGTPLAGVSHHPNPARWPRATRGAENHHLCSWPTLGPCTNSQRCCNKRPRTGRLQTMRIQSCVVLEVGSLQPEVLDQNYALPPGLWETHSFLF